MRRFIAALRGLAKEVFSLTAPEVKDHSSRSHNALQFECLEPRLTLAAAGLVDVGSQPDGGLSGKIVYVHAGHGYTTYNNGETNAYWGFQRPYLLDMVEDLGNQDQMSLYADYLFRAGATVVPLRPIGTQANEVVLDNDDVEVTFTGSWNNSSSPIYFGDAGDVPYRYAGTSSSETAVATYTPNISEAGYYPVYTWVRAGSDRVSQLYRVNHSGGTTEVRVDHSLVGNGLVYLGTYYFDEGTEGSVEISNQSSESGVVIADMIRFGNGVGDIDRGAGASGLGREDEAGLYWVMWHVNHSQGIDESVYRSSSDDRTATVSLSPRYAAYMNREAAGTLSDRVFVSYHSNAGSGSNRGVLGLYNGNNTPSSATPNQFLLANTVAREINDDLVDQDGQFEYDWYDRGSTVTLDRSDIEFGEIHNSYIDDEFDATIMETGFHDNTEDAAMLLDWRVRDALARATYQGTVNYFNNVDGGETSLTKMPGVVTDVSAETAGSGSITVSWTPAEANSYDGDAPTGYMIYGSTNGYGFDGGTYVAGGATASHTFTGLDVNEGVYYFKVVAVNEGGEGRSSEVVAALPNAGAKDILIVNGFDRLDRSLSPEITYAGGTAQRVRLQNSNSGDYVVQVASAIEANNPDLVVDSASNEAVINGDISLSDYKAVFWILGEESSENSTFDPSEQTLVTSYLNVGGQLFLSGSEVGWDLDALNNGRSFYNNELMADYVSDDANSYSVSGVAGGIFEGLSFQFDDGTQYYDAQFPDVITPLGGAETALTYSTGGGAGIVFDGGSGGARVVNLAFPFETITTEGDREQVLGKVLDFFDFETTLPQVSDQILDNDDGALVYSEIGNWLNGSGSGYDGGTYRYAGAGTNKSATWEWTAPFAGTGEVFVQYRADANNASNAVYEIETQQGVQTATADQTTNNLAWVSLGTFDFSQGTGTVTLNAQASSGGYIVVADAVRIILVESVGDADFDQDGDVDLTDLMSWQRGYGNGSTLAEGDANGDATVDAQDLTFWQSQFGTAEPAASSAIVMEAASSAMSVEAASSVVAEEAVEPEWIGAAQALAVLPQAEDVDAHFIEAESRQAEARGLEPSRYVSAASETVSALDFAKPGSPRHSRAAGDAISAMDDFYEQLELLAPAGRWAW